MQVIYSAQYQTQINGLLLKSLLLRVCPLHLSRQFKYIYHGQICGIQLKNFKHFTNHSLQSYTPPCKEPIIVFSSYPCGLQISFPQIHLLHFQLFCIIVPFGSCVAAFYSCFMTLRNYTSFKVNTFSIPNTIGCHILGK